MVRTTIAPVYDKELLFLLEMFPHYITGIEEFSDGLL